MTQIGTVIDGKYEILKEIGRGGMSVVYLAMDKHLNKQWAVKEIRKKGSGKNDEIVVNSLLAEANMMKRLDHPALPRIVDIIDNGVTIYVIMDYIEGESLDKILNEYGAQPEELVIGWAKQLCDALGYLHSQKPPIIYRDMKPANVMLKPEGNIKIIDFGIAREYKEMSLADTTVLGTKGYAPPEQYSGQTDPRSDIFALGMTMHHLLTGVDPRNGDAYVPVRQWNPELSEGIEAIIDKCVEPAAENRYQSCSDLLYDLEHPDLITKGYKKKQKRKLISFIAAIGMSALFAFSGVTMRLASKGINNSDYQTLINSANPSSFGEAIKLFKNRPEAYIKLVEYYKGNKVENNELKSLSNNLTANRQYLDLSKEEVGQLYYDAGRLVFSEYNGDLKDRAGFSRPLFEIAASDGTSFAKKDLAKCFFSICKFMATQNKSTEKSLTDYQELFDDIEGTVAKVDGTSDQESNYDKISLYYATMLFVNDNVDYMASVGFDKQRVLNLMSRLYDKTRNITSSLDYVNALQEKTVKIYPSLQNNIEIKYNEAEKRRNGGV